LRLLIELCWFTHSRAWNSRNIGCTDCQGNWKNKEKIFLYFFLANKSEKDYENSFRILREKFFSCMDSPDCSNSVVLVAEPSGKVLCGTILRACVLFLFGVLESLQAMHFVRVFELSTTVDNVVCNFLSASP
jgi:hypothetical protein